MTIDWTKPIEDMNGNPARLISEDYKTAKGYARLVQIDFGATSLVYPVDARGFHTSFDNQEIRNRKVKKMGWVNIYRSSCGERSIGVLFPTKERAEFVGNGAVATIKIEWEE
jgi:hypothetical protein